MATPGPRANAAQAARLTKKAFFTRVLLWGSVLKVAIGARPLQDAPRLLPLVGDRMSVRPARLCRADPSAGRRVADEALLAAFAVRRQTEVEEGLLHGVVPNTDLQDPACLFGGRNLAPQLLGHPHLLLDHLDRRELLPL